MITEIVSADFARELERKLTEAEKEIAYLERRIEDLTKT